VRYVRIARWGDCERRIGMNEDAIDRKLVCAFIDGLISDDGERKKGLEYIRSMPPVNPQPCEDAISRQAAIEAEDSK